MGTVDTLARIDRMAVPAEFLSAGVFDRDPLGEMPVIGSSDIAEQRARTVAAKLSLPHTGFILRRPRLHALAEPVRGGGVITLVAGPGYGKTSLIVDLLSSTRGRTSYFSVDEGDRDAKRFLAYLMAGLGLDPDLAADASDTGLSALAGGDGGVLDLTATLVDSMCGLAGQTTVVAIDDLHLVDASPGVVSALELIVRGLPPAWTLLLSSRRPLPLRLAGVNLGGRLVQLHGRDLRLTPTEVGAWAWQNWAVRLQPSEARALWRLTQGWPAALVLLGQRLLSGGAEVKRQDIAGVIARGRDLRAYLERDILAGMDPMVADTVLAAAMLPRVIFPRDESFLPGGPGQAEAILEEFVSQGYLVTTNGPRTYTLHPLLRAFSERRAQQKGSAALLDRAAAHLVRIGEYHRAASLYLRAGRLREAEGPLRSLMLSSSGSGPSITKEEWLDAMPAGIASENGDNPWVLVTQGRILQQQAKYAQAVELYERAARGLAASGDKEGLLPVLMSISFCLFNQGLWETNLDVLKRCRSLAGAPTDKAEVLISEGATLVGLCRWDEAVEDWERALVLAPAENRSRLTQRVHIHRGRLFYCLGQYGLARRWFERADEQTGQSSSVASAAALNGLATTLCLSGKYDRAEQAAAECRRLIDNRGYAYLEPACLCNQADIALGHWDYRGAVMKLKEAKALAADAGDAEAGFWAEDMLGDLCRRNSNAQRALEHHQRALDIVQKSRLGALERVQAGVGEGMDLVLLGRDEEAKALLQEMVRMARRWTLSSALTRALFYLGWLQACSGREAEAARSLGEAMRVAEEHCQLHFFSQEAKLAAPILALCDRFGARSFVRGSLIPMLPERLREYFLELAEGKTYPTDVPLGPRRRRSVAPPDAAQRGLAAAEVVSTEGIDSLTDREREILDMISSGMSNKMIGSRLYISEKTVKTHANHIFHKLGVTSRLQATLVLQSSQRASAQKPARRRGRT